MERFDVVVIGAGPGGYPAAIRAAQLGASVAIVERDRFGGTCLNYGCIPTKTLIASAETFAHVRDAKAFGVSVSGATFDYAAMVRRKDKVVDQLRGGVKQLLTANGVKSFAGSAAFKDRETIVIDGGVDDRREADDHRHRLDLGDARLHSRARADRREPRLPRARPAAEEHDRARRRLHRLRNRLDGGDARRQGHDRRTARRHPDAARRRPAQRGPRPYGKGARNPRADRQAARRHRRRRQRRARPLRRRNAARPSCCSTPSAAGR